MARQRRELVQYPATIRPATHGIPPASATTNSSCVVMLISLMLAPAGEHR